jgi:putative ABC transport system permease protein
VVGAVAISPLFPLGVARRAEPDPGPLADGLVLVVGAVLLVAVVALTAVLAGRRAARRNEVPDRASSVGGAVNRSGAPPSVVVGLGLVGDRSRSRSAVRTAMVGAAVALAGVCAVAVLSGSLADVLDQPDRYGWPWTAKPDVEDPETTIPALIEEPDVAAVGVVDSASIDIDGRGLEGFALEVLKGSIAFPVLEGRVPTSTTEVALGDGVLPDRVVGDTVTLRTPDDPTVELQVVGRVVLPHIDSAGVNTALVVPELIPDLAVDEERSLVLTYADGVDAAALEARLEDEHGLTFPAYARPNPPGRLVHLDAIGSLLAALAAFFALLGVAGLAHALTTSSRRHRGLFATLRSLGFVRPQVVWSVVISAVTIVGMSAFVGIPIGIVIGRQAWLSAVEELGIVDTPTVPAVTITVIVTAALMVAVVVAGVPAWRASRRHPADALRSE